jgi:lipoyl(octanoyl) transferase
MACSVPQMSDRRLSVCDLGRDVDYDDAFSRQERLVAQRRDGAAGDTLLLLEHAPVYTLGRNAVASHVVFSPAELAARGIRRVNTTRGGDVTYHGPGQLVGYPILDLGRSSRHVVWYVDNLEKALIETVAGLGIEAQRDSRNRGVWVGNSKLAALGVRVSQGITMHGFALNVNVNLDDYAGIVACGIRDAGVTSMDQVLGHAVPMDTVKAAVADAFVRVFGYQGTSVG